VPHAGLILASTLVAALEGVAQSLVLPLIAGCQALQQLLDVRDLRRGRSSKSQCEDAA
jgi:hypothetical protein